MQTTGVAAATSDATTQTNTQSLGDDTGEMFLTLLVTQLKTQDPLSPMDPTAFVGQLVQFNTLSQIMQIRQDLDQLSGNV
jgi:flagellar basal-body rod modification protein FlgD